MKRDSTRSAEKRHPIQVVARRLGLTADVLRAWEKRYQLITPTRSQTGRRLYSDADVERLRLVQSAMAAGRRVGQLAGLSTDELKAMLEEDRRELSVAASRDDRDGDSYDPETFLAEALNAVRELDAPSLKTALRRAVIALSPVAFLDEVAAPLMHQIGELWWEGKLSPSHEHVASAAMTYTLSDVERTFESDNGAPMIVVGTPTGQRHEIGAMLVSTAAAVHGWRVIYLGPDLPAGDIAAAAKAADARAVALSIVFPPNDSKVRAELEKLRELLPAEVAIVLGGRSASSYKDTATEIGAPLLNGLASFRAFLEGLATSSE